MRRRRCQASCSRATSPWSMRSPSRPPTKSKNTSSNSNCCKSWAARRPEGRPGMSPHDDPLAQDPLLRELAELQQRHWPAAIARKPAYPFGELALSEYLPPFPPRPNPASPFGELALSEYLRRWAALQPQKAAVIFYGQTITYAQLDALSERCAALLARHGVKAGERVAVMLPNCPQYHIVFFAILKLGAVHVPVNPLFKAQELLYELNDSSAKTLVVLDQLAEMAGRGPPRTSGTTGLFTNIHYIPPPAAGAAEHPRATHRTGRHAGPDACAARRHTASTATVATVATAAMDTAD